MPKRRAVLVSLSQTSGSGAPSPRSTIAPRRSSSQRSAACAARSCGRGAPSVHDQRLRNHSVGSTCSSAASGPALRTRSRMQMSSGRRLRVGGLDVPVAVVVEGAGVEQLVLEALTAAAPVLLQQVRVRERAPAGTRSATASTSAWASSRGTTSTPWRPRRGCPRCPVSPKTRSFRIGSRPFQNAQAKQRRCDSSQMPPRPSSLQRYARERAWSCGRYSHAVPPGL